MAESTCTLEEQGFTRVPNVLDDATLDALRAQVEALWEQEGDRAGSEFRQEPESRRLANLADKGELFYRLIALPEVLSLVRTVLGPDCKLSSLNARSANPRQSRGQPLHADMAALPDARGAWVCNTVWLLDDFTTENGALRVVPGSHRWGRLPQEVLPDPYAPHPDEVLLTGAAGTVFVVNAHTWHAGTANRTDAPRRAIHGFYCRRDRPQQQYQKALLRAETRAALSPELLALLALEDPENDRLSQAVTTRSGFLK